MADDSDIQRILHDAADPGLAPDRLVFFVGAGLSMPRPSGVPDFAHFNREILRLSAPAGFWEETPHTGLTDLARSIRTEVLMQAAIDEFGSQAEEFYEWLNVGRPNANHRFLAQALKVGHHVLTTNQDQLIEQAYLAMFGQEISPAVEEADYSDDLRKNAMRDDSRGRLFKLHGTLGNVRLSLNQVGAGIFRGARELLEMLIAQRDMVVVGYSGRDDFSVQPILVRTATERRIHWIQFSSEPSGSLQMRPSSPQNWIMQNDEALQALLAGEGPKDFSVIHGEDWAIRKILGSRRSGLALHYCGDVSKVLHEIQGEPYAGIEPGPALSPPGWLLLEGNGRRLAFLARVYEAARLPTQARQVAESALEKSSNEEHRARLHRILARIALLGGPKTAKAAVPRVREALAYYVANGPRDSAVEVHLELVNQLRRGEEFAQAWAEIRKISPDLSDAFAASLPTSSAPSIARSFCSQLGLLWHGPKAKEGLPITRDMAIAALRRGVEHATGMPREAAAALNALGLVLNANFRDDETMLEEAHRILAEAFGFNLMVGDSRALYANTRNNAWARSNLSMLVAPDRDRALQLSQEAVRLGRQAVGFAASLGAEAVGEIATAKRDYEEFCARDVRVRGTT